MKPAVQPVDAAQLIKDWAKTALMTPFPTLDVRMEHRDDWELGDNPELVVFDDSGPLDQWPVVTRPTIRVTTWTTGRDVSIVNRVLGLMLCTPGSRKSFPAPRSSRPAIPPAPTWRRSPSAPAYAPPLCSGGPKPPPLSLWVEPHSPFTHRPERG